MNQITTQHNMIPPPPPLLSRSLQGSIQQLVLKSDPTAPDDQCEEDDPYVSVHEISCKHLIEGGKSSVRNTTSVTQIWISPSPYRR